MIGLFASLLAAFSVAVLLLLIVIRFKYNRQKPDLPSDSFLSRLLPVIEMPLADFVRINLPAILLLAIARAGQYFSFSSAHAIAGNACFLEFHGFVNDLVVWQFIAWAVLVPFMLLSILKRWIGNLFLSIVFLGYILLEWLLFEYYKIALIPLDEVVFSYSLREMIMITGYSLKISFVTWIPFLLLFLATLAFIFLSYKLRISRFAVTAALVLSISLIVFRHRLIPSDATSRNVPEYYFSTNKSIFLAKRCVSYLRESKINLTREVIGAAAKRYQSRHPEFRFLGTGYPFLHYDDTPDVLSSFFNLKQEKPTIVIVIVESLSSCFSGDNKIYGSFTPFLDSLSKQSLYWPNFLSTADRTFNVIEAVTGSMPPGYDSFVTPNDDAKYPHVLSLVKYLASDGYFTGFYHGGDPAFNNMDDFLVHQKIGYILRYFGPGYHKFSFKGDEGPSWGYPDHEAFNRSFEVLDSLNRSPRLDLFLTVTTHTPFTIPDPEYWLARADEHIRNAPSGLLAADDLKNNRTIFAAILYSDNALRMLLENYKNRRGYENTIFIITGDHAMPEINPVRASLLERFRTPLLIYSPMLKRPVEFLSVSSHLDITPTLLAMLQKRYGLQKTNVAPWLGSGIDTARSFRNIHTLPFIVNSRAIQDYLDRSHFLSQNTLSIVMPDLNLTPINDGELTEQLQGDLRDVKILSRYVLWNNRLVPPEVYFGKTLRCDTITLAKDPDFSGVDLTWEYKNICEQFLINPKYKLLKLEVTVRYHSPATCSGRPPKLVFDLTQKGTGGWCTIPMR